jgi:hypothetical protein
MCFNFIKAGAQINTISKNGQSCLTEAVRSGNKSLAAYALKNGAKVFFEEDMKFNESSPFYVALNLELIWAIELFCDAGVDPFKT